MRGCSQDQSGKKRRESRSTRVDCSLLETSSPRRCCCLSSIAQRGSPGFEKARLDSRPTSNCPTDYCLLGKRTQHRAMKRHGGMKRRGRTGLGSRAYLRVTIGSRTYTESPSTRDPGRMDRTARFDLPRHYPGSDGAALACTAGSVLSCNEGKAREQTLGLCVCVGNLSWNSLISSVYCG